MSEERIYVVDRIEGRRVVLIGDDETESVLRRRDLSVRVSEGSVLRVRVTGENPDWSTARLDPGEQARRVEDAKRRMDALRQRDPGGDLEL